jgi:cyclohexyl-isocyanide hydratase
MREPMVRRTAFVLLPNITQLDLTAPYEVFARVPNNQLQLVAHSMDPVRTDRGLMLMPTATFETCTDVEVVCVPGGPGQVEAMEDDRVLDFLRRAAEGARYLTSVCTGALLLGAAGLLRGRRATTHWSALDQLAMFGAEPVTARYVFDGPIATSSGVSAGIDFGLAMVAELCGEAQARAIALGLEYRPEPPFVGGHPEVESHTVREAVGRRNASLWERRLAASQRAAARLK